MRVDHELMNSNTKCRSLDQFKLLLGVAKSNSKLRLNSNNSLE